MEKVTIYKKGEFMGNIIKTETHLDHFKFDRWAQYPNALFIQHRPKRKRTMYRQVASPTFGSSDVLILKGWNNPDPDGLYDPSKRKVTKDVTINVGRYSSFDNRWQSDFDSMINQYIEAGEVEVVLDTRGHEAHNKAVQEFKTVEA